jgi:hypothetical protein
MTNEQKDRLQQLFEENSAHPENELGNYEHTDYMKRQPRLELRSKNFNFEDFRRFTQTYEKARAIDEANSREFY